MSAQEEAAGVRLVSAEEAQGWLPELVAEYAGTRAHRCVYTVATEPDRTRAAVVKALLSAGREVAEDMNLVSYENGLTIEKFMERRAGAIENGAEW